MIEEEADLGVQGQRNARYYYDQGGRLIFTARARISP